MTDTDWSTHEPPWLHQLRPDLVEAPAPAERTPEQRAADLVEQLERAAAGRVPPALAGAGWREAHVAEYSDEPAQPVVRARTTGPWPCQLPEPLQCDECDQTRPTQLALAIHKAEHRRDHERAERRRNRNGGNADKPKPGARKKTKKRR